MDYQASLSNKLSMPPVMLCSFLVKVVALPHSLPTEFDAPLLNTRGSSSGGGRASSSRDRGGGDVGDLLPPYAIALIVIAGVSLLVSAIIYIGRAKYGRIRPSSLPSLPTTTRAQKEPKRIKSQPTRPTKPGPIYAPLRPPPAYTISKNGGLIR